MAISANIKDHFFFEDGITYLDSGGFGATPKEVIATSHMIRQEIEKSPRFFFDKQFSLRLRKVAELVAQRFSCLAEDVALVGNVTEGINAVLRSLSFEPNDEILVTSLSYGAVVYAANYIAGRCGAKVVAARLQFPHPSPAQCVEAIKSAITPHTKLVILDHVTSSTALLLPVREMIRVCRERGVAVLVDGAHAPVNVALDVPALDADYYVGNLHKWGFAARACGFLWARPERQNGLMPAILSWDIDKPFPYNFDWMGTRDPSGILSLPAAFEFIDRYGEDNIRQHNHHLLREGMNVLAKSWGIRINTPDEMISSGMALVPLPDAMPFPPGEEGRRNLQETLWNNHKVIAVSCYSHEGHHWVRIAAQIYNDVSDYGKLARAVECMR